jgi:acyl carrier protein
MRHDMVKARITEYIREFVADLDQEDVDYILADDNATEEEQEYGMDCLDLVQITIND